MCTRSWKFCVPEVRTRGFDSNLSMTSFVGSAMFAICFGLPAGQPFEAGGGVVGGAVAFWITAVGTELAWSLPSAFFAITRNRSVLPTSAEVSVYFVA